MPHCSNSSAQKKPHVSKLHKEHGCYVAVLGLSLGFSDTKVSLHWYFYFINQFPLVQLLICYSIKKFPNDKEHVPFSLFSLHVVGHFSINFNMFNFWELEPQVSSIILPLV